MTDRTPLDVAGVARALGHTPTWFRRHRKTLEDKHGFPKPIRGLGLRWDPRAIQLWKDSDIPAHLRPEARTTGAEGVALSVDFGAELDRRAEQLAARH